MRQPVSQSAIQSVQKQNKHIYGTLCRHIAPHRIESGVVVVVVFVGSGSSDDVCLFIRFVSDEKLISRAAQCTILHSLRDKDRFSFCVAEEIFSFTPRDNTLTRHTLGAEFCTSTELQPPPLHFPSFERNEQTSKPIGCISMNEPGEVISGQLNAGSMLATVYGKRTKLSTKVSRTQTYRDDSANSIGTSA